MLVQTQDEEVISLQSYEPLPAIALANTLLTLIRIGIEFACRATEIKTITHR